MDAVGPGAGWLFAALSLIGTVVSLIKLLMQQKHIRELTKEKAATEQLELEAKTAEKKLDILPDMTKTLIARIEAVEAREIAARTQAAEKEELLRRQVAERDLELEKQRNKFETLAEALREETSSYQRAHAVVMRENELQRQDSTRIHGELVKVQADNTALQKACDAIFREYEELYRTLGYKKSMPPPVQKAKATISASTKRKE